MTGELVGAENYDISTRRLKGDRSASELYTVIGIRGETRYRTTAPSGRFLYPYSHFRPHGSRLLRCAWATRNMVDAGNSAIPTKSLRGSHSASELRVHIMVPRPRFELGKPSF
jgi:hypothetical protein